MGGRPAAALLDESPRRPGVDSWSRVVTDTALHISTLSTEYVRIPVSARVSGAWVNLTADAVTIALPARGVAPVSGDWKAASWETDSTTSPATYYARLLVGPGAGGTTYLAGPYDCYVKVTDNPEVPVLLAGQVVFY